MLLTKYRKFLATLVVASLLLSPISYLSLSAKYVKAVEGLGVSGTGNEVPVSDLVVRVLKKTYNIKEFSGDNLAFAIANTLIETISKSVVNWINSGFEGKPAFVQDLKRHFVDLGNTVFANYIDEIGAGFLCSPFSARIKQSLEIQLAIRESGGRNAQEAIFRRNNQCTLDDVLSNVGSTIEEFTNDFSRGGWPAWIEITRARNNEIGAYLIVRQELFRRQGEVIENRQRELTYGGGFLSWKKGCDYYDTPNQQAPSTDDGVDYQISDDGDGSIDSSDDIYSGDCLDPTEGEIQTPGSVIENQLNEALGLGPGRLQVADEINEIISALFAQLVNQALGGPGGLFGASNGSGGRPSYIDQIDGDQQDLSRSKNYLINQIDDSIRNIDGVINFKRIGQNDVRVSLTNLDPLELCLNDLQNQGRTYPAGENTLVSVETELLDYIAQYDDEIDLLVEARNLLIDLIEEVENPDISISDLDQITQDYIATVQDLSILEDRDLALRELEAIRNRIQELEEQVRLALNQCQSIRDGVFFGF